MDQTNEILSLARERAEKRLDRALADVRAATLRVAREHNVPEGVLGHDQVDLLGRIMHTPALSRDLRREACQLMAKQELEALNGGAAPTQPRARQEPAPVDPAGGLPVIPMGKALQELDGVGVATVKALNQNGMQVVGDVVNVPDEHLAKMGLSQQQISAVRRAIAKAAQGPK